MEHIAQYIFGSVYVLENPEHILKSFASTNEGKRSECKYDGKNFIVITGKENAGQTLPVFVKIFKSYIEKELDPQRDVFEA